MHNAGASGGTFHKKNLCCTALHIEKSTSDSCQNKPKLDCIYHLPIDLEQNGIWFNSKSIGKL